MVGRKTFSEDFMKGGHKMTLRNLWTKITTYIQKLINTLMLKIVIEYSWDKIWEKYTIQARKAIYSAEREAYRLGCNWIGLEHLLLGLIYEDNNVRRILEKMGINLENLRRKTERIIILKNNKFKAKKEIILTTDGKRALEQSVIIAYKLSKKYIDTEHLLIGIIQADKDKAISCVFRELGIDLKMIEVKILQNKI